MVDTGPLIILYQIGALDLLRELYGEVLIPEAVRDELLRGPSGQAILSRTWVKVRGVIDRSVLEVLRAFLDDGEAEAIQLAREVGATVIIIDERKGRRIARSLGLKVRGTLGILLELKEKGLVEAVRPFISRMLGKGYYLDEKLIEEVLKAAGEGP